MLACTLVSAWCSERATVSCAWRRRRRRRLLQSTSTRLEPATMPSHARCLVVKTDRYRSRFTFFFIIYLRLGFHALNHRVPGVDAITKFFCLIFFQVRDETTPSRSEVRIVPLGSGVGYFEKMYINIIRSTV